MPDDPTLPMNKRAEVGKPPEGILLGDLSGHTLGEYRIDSLLGRGGCGSVYLAHDTPLDRSVAVKVLGGSQSPAVSDQSVQRFMREARAIASVDHPNIVHIHRVAQEGDICYIVMQYVKGDTLSRRIRAPEQISTADAILIALQVSNALEAAHRIDLVHRDIKPSNVMIDPEGQVKVMDFGLARTSSPDTAITHTGMFVGTPRYSSPEQCETSTIDCRSDLYSLGVTLYEMLAGKVPHEADTPLALMHKIVHEPPVPLAELNPDVPEDLVAVVDRLLAKPCEDRYQSAAQLSADLRQILERLKDDSAQPFEPTIQIPTESYSRGASGGTVIALKAAAAVLILLAVALGIWFAYPGRETAPPGGKIAGPDKPVAEITGFAVMAIYDFSNVTKDPTLDWLSLGVPDMLSASLTQYDFIDLKARDQILWSVNPRPERLDDRLLAKLTELNVGIVVKGSIYREADKLRFVVHIHDLAQRRNVKSLVRKGTTETIFATIDALSGDITAAVSEHIINQNGKAPLLASQEKNQQAYVSTRQMQASKFAFVADMGVEAVLKAVNDEMKQAELPHEPESPEDAAGPEPGAGAADADSVGGTTVDGKKGISRKAGPSAEWRGSKKEASGDKDVLTGDAHDRLPDEGHGTAPKVAARVQENLPLLKRLRSARNLDKKDREDLQKRMVIFYQGNCFLNSRKLTKDAHEREVKALLAALRQAASGDARGAYQEWQKAVQKRAPQK